MPRARRVTIGVILAGGVVIGILLVLQLRLHLEAWRFQKGRSTMKLEPDPGLRECLAGATGTIEVDAKSCLRILSTYSGLTVIAEPDDLARARVLRSKNLKDRDPLVLPALTAEVARHALEARGWRVIKQHVPTRAYVVFRDEPILVEDSPPALSGPMAPAPIWVEEEFAGSHPDLEGQ